MRIGAGSETGGEDRMLKMMSNVRPDPNAFWFLIGLGIICQQREPGRRSGEITRGDGGLIIRNLIGPTGNGS